MKLQKIELKPVKESQSGCRAVIRSSGCSIFPCKEEALSASPLQPVALLTHGSQDTDTPIPVHPAWWPLSCPVTSSCIL